MERRIKNYEEYIKKRVKSSDAKLIEYHREMIKNFQHERLIHLIIMLFFIMITLTLIGVLTWLLALVSVKYWMDFLPLVIATLLLIILCVFYVKHYYFLENHIQGLYDISQELYENVAQKKAEKNDKKAS
ncbi:hypothetical protein IJG78_01895 [Candidatus Saccharibacteria bacterium]|nr:hypothetical protein [Candidatus Saccharibacteria bacterium]